MPELYPSCMPRGKPVQTLAQVIRVLRKMSMNRADNAGEVQGWQRVASRSAEVCFALRVPAENVSGAAQSWTVAISGQLRPCPVTGRNESSGRRAQSADAAKDGSRRFAAGGSAALLGGRCGCKRTDGAASQRLLSAVSHGVGRTRRATRFATSSKARMEPWRD